MKKLPLLPVFLISFCLFAQPGLHAKSLILPVEAIDDTAVMGASEFEETHKGIDVSGYIPDEKGYYIIYAHTNLNYYFGPLDDPEEALRWKAKLQKIVNRATALRPNLQKGIVDIYLFDPETLEQIIVIGAVDDELVPDMIITGEEVQATASPTVQDPNESTDGADADNSGSESGEASEETKNEDG